MLRNFCIWTSLAIAGAASAQVIIYDSNGYEGMSPGDYAGQDVFSVGTDGPGSASATIVDPSAPGEHGYGSGALRLDVSDDVGTSVTLSLNFPQDLAAAGYTAATFSMDIYREGDGWNSNLWYYFLGNNPTFGLQWDSGGTLPVGFGGPSIPTALDRFATLEVTWDFVNRTASGSYDGQAFTFDYPADAAFDSFPGFEFYLARENGEPNRGPETVWIDNFTITAVPAPGSVMVLSGAALFGTRRRR